MHWTPVFIVIATGWCGLTAPRQTLAALPSDALFEWQTAAADELGLAPAKLDAMKDVLAARGTSGLLIVRSGKIAYEWYAPASGPHKPHYTASMAKALVGGMSLLLALNDGRIGVDDLAAKYIPAWRDDPRKSRITIRQLASHTSGIEDAEEEGKRHEELTGWKGAFWKRDPDPFTIALARAPVVFDPGTGNAYSNPGMAALAYAVTAALRTAPQTDIRSLLKERVMDPLGIPEKEWSIGYGQAYEVDGLSLFANWGGGGYTARAAARVGQLMLHRGEWNHRRLIGREFVRQALAPSGLPDPSSTAADPAPASGFAWWLNAKGVWPRVPRDAFAGAGAGHQLLIVIPSLDLVLVRYGEALDLPTKGGSFWAPVVRYVLNPLMDAVAVKAPYPPSSVIRKIDFAPESTIVRKALGSDNWPVTWGDDGEQYTSYGDGWGFEPLLDRKLSMGFAKIIGGATNFTAVNIRSASGERTGDGKDGAKASGMLMVGGVLYMWVRNTGNAQLAWSSDRGRTWEWGFRFDTAFGSPAFLNFGRNYAGARDDYVYTYSQDGPSAYESDDALVLARVPQDRIRERDAWEFFERLDAAGSPVWTSDIARRGEVFRYPGRCQRVDAVYNPGLKRYLLALGFDHSGGWGIFDAPEPWGPWTTAFHTDDWGLGGTHGYRLPAKWIGAGGTEMYLIFSGANRQGITTDAFCLRRLTLTVE
jgi:CubicO group peptidase (beta-lactamase class C family)